MRRGMSTRGGISESVTSGTFAPWRRPLAVRLGLVVVKTQLKKEPEKRNHVLNTPMLHLEVSVGKDRFVVSAEECHDSRVLKVLCRRFDTRRVGHAG